jgi:hypothetical protein
MKPSSHSLKAFLESLKGKGYEDAVLLAERESMNAYRMAMRPCRRDGLHATDWCAYSRQLADMICFLRCESKPLKADPEIRLLIASVKEGFSKQAV